MVTEMFDLTAYVLLSSQTRWDSCLSLDFWNEVGNESSYLDSIPTRQLKYGPLFLPFQVHWLSITCLPIYPLFRFALVVLFWDWPNNEDPPRGSVQNLRDLSIGLSAAFSVIDGLRNDARSPRGEGSRRQQHHRSPTLISPSEELCQSSTRISFSLFQKTKQPKSQAIVFSTIHTIAWSETLLQLQQYN